MSKAVLRLSRARDGGAADGPQTDNEVQEIRHYHEKNRGFRQACWRRYDRTPRQ